MERGRGRLEPPDLSEKGGLRNGEPQRSDERLFMQFLAFGGCRDAQALGRQLGGAGIDGVVYEDVNDPRGVGILTLSTAPDTFIDIVRPVLNTPALAELVRKPEYTMFGRTYSLG